MNQAQHNKTVRLGIVIGLAATLLLGIGLYAVLPTLTEEVALPARIKLGITSLLFPAALFLLMVARVGSQRFGNPSEDPTQVEANSARMKIDLRVLSNTHEQLIIFVITALGLCVLLPYAYLSLLPIYSGLFVTGRILFWVAYHHHALWRAPGFAMTVMPAVAGLGYCCGVILLRAF